MKAADCDGRACCGFTLVELSIVLVILGLIVGGVLVGQDLIKAAEIRAAVAQVEQYNAAVNTFRSKYTGLPGDLTGSKAVVFGFGPRAGEPGRGDGNGLLEGVSDNIPGGYDPALAGVQCAGELRLMWNDLSVAALIDGQYSGTDSNSLIPDGGTDPAYQFETVFPAAKVGRGTFLIAFSANGRNDYQLSGLDGCGDGTGCFVGLNPTLAPLESAAIDFKIDDGIPNRGQVRGLQSNDLNTACADGGAGLQTDRCCENNGAPILRYNTFTSATATTPLCQLRLRMN